MPEPAAAHRHPDRLIGVVTVADILGVTRQRASVLVNRPDFPTPADLPPELAGATLGRLWRRGDVEAWDANDARASNASAAELDTCRPRVRRSGSGGH